MSKTEQERYDEYLKNFKPDTYTVNGQEIKTVPMSKEEYLWMEEVCT